MVTRPGNGGAIVTGKQTPRLVGPVGRYAGEAGRYVSLKSRGGKAITQEAPAGPAQSSTIQQAFTPPETAGESVRTSVRCAVVPPSFAPSPALFGPMVTTFQPTTA